LAPPDGAASSPTNFTFANVRLAVTGIAEHAKAKTKEPTILVGYDTRFYSEEFSQLAVAFCSTMAFERCCVKLSRQRPRLPSKIMRRKLDGAINFTASHNPCAISRVEFSSADAAPPARKSPKDIEARAAQLAAKGGVSALPHGASNSARGEKVNLRENYLKRLEELVQFDTLRKAKPLFIVDALHGCGGRLSRSHTRRSRCHRASHAHGPRLPLRWHRPRRL